MEDFSSLGPFEMPQKHTRHTSAPAGTKVGHIKRYAPNSVQGRQSLEPYRSSPTLTPFRAEGRDKTAKYCPRDTHNHGTELAMKVVRQARLELSGGSTPGQLGPHAWYYNSL